MTAPKKKSVSDSSLYPPCPSGILQTIGFSNSTYFNFLGWLWQATSVTFSYFVVVGSASFFLVWDVFSQTVVGENFKKYLEWVTHLCTPVWRFFSQGMFITISSLFSANKLILVPVLKVPQIKKKTDFLANKYLPT